MGKWSSIFVVGRAAIVTCVVGRAAIVTYVVGRAAIVTYVVGRAAIVTYVVGRAAIVTYANVVVVQGAGRVACAISQPFEEEDYQYWGLHICSCT